MSQFSLRNWKSLPVDDGFIGVLINRARIADIANSRAALDDLSILRIRKKIETKRRHLHQGIKYPLSPLFEFLNQSSLF